MRVRSFCYFVLLKLKEKFGSMVVPPFPGRTMFFEDNESPQFLEKRRASLEVYLQKLLKHPRWCEKCNMSSATSMKLPRCSTCCLGVDVTLALGCVHTNVFLLQGFCKQPMSATFCIRQIQCLCLPI